MIEINIDPTMFTLGPLVISWHGFFSAFGLAIGLWLAMRLAVERRIDEAINTLALPAVIGGILGARVLFVLENWWLFADRPLAAFAINEGGISVYGAVFGGSLAAWLATRFLRPPAPDTEEGDAAPSTRSFPVAKLADLAALGLIFGQGLGRIGDIINGEHHGKDAVDFPLSVSYTHPNTLGELGVPVHLAVGYEMVYDLVVGFGLILLLKHQPKDGVVYLAYLFLYGLGRLVIGFYRRDTLVMDGLGMAQVIGLITMLIVLPWLMWHFRTRPPDRAQRRRAGR